MTLTERVSQRLVELMAAPLPSEVITAASDTLFNVLGTSIGASRSDAVEVVLQHDATHGGRGLASVPGRTERLDMLHAALAIGIAAHYDDFDDTHLETVIHPGAATLAALLPIASHHPVRGMDALKAFALGIETQLRFGLAISPTHYDDGWHITSTCGMIGAAVTSGLMMGLDAHLLQNAIAISASQSLGLREAFGTHTKPFHPGKAASNGVLSALLASEGMTGPVDALESSRGLAAVLGREHPEKLINWLDGIGTSPWEIERNAFKPYPCGIVSHPCIDAAVELHGPIAGRTIESVTVRCHPLVPELTGNRDPKDGLQARISTVHGVAAGLADGQVGLAQYADERVRHGDLIALRAITVLQAEEHMPRDASEVHVTLSDGDHVSSLVEHARGSIDRPFTREELDAKVALLTEPILPGRWRRIRTAVDELAGADGLDELIAACTPGEVLV